ncbi:MAG: prepilin peptidase [Clostridiales bacterium]|nr:prepilin peptidase [Candidatus Crickella merdequi]
MTYNVIFVIKIGIALALAVIFGNGCVVVFNRVPARWFEDWTGEGDKRRLPDRLLETMENGRQRLPSTPWKMGFTAFFVFAGIYLATKEPLQYLIGAMIVMAVVLEMAVSDALYMVVPDQFMILLCASAVGFIGLHNVWWEPLAGAGVGLALSFAVFGTGRLLFHKDAIGGADIKFYIAIGLVTGVAGVVVIFVMTSMISLVLAAVASFRKRGLVGTAGEANAVAMLPGAFAATSIYLLFMWETLELLIM